MGSTHGPAMAAALVVALAAGGVMVGLALRPAGEPATDGGSAAQADPEDGSHRPVAPSRALHRAVDRPSAAPLADAATATPAGVDWDDPEAVIRVYLRARYAVTPRDAGQRHRRHAAYAHPAADAFELGHRPVDVPGRGRRRITVETLELRARAADRAAWRVGWIERDPGGATRSRHRDLVLQRYGGRWLVRHDTAALDPAP